MKNEIEIPPGLTETEKIEYLKVAAEYWKNYYLELCRVVEGKRLLDSALPHSE